MDESLHRHLLGQFTQRVESNLANPCQIQRVRQQLRNAYAQLENLLDEQHDYPQAADQIRRLMFLEKLLFDIDEAIAALEE